MFIGQHWPPGFQHNDHICEATSKPSVGHAWVAEYTTVPMPMPFLTAVPGGREMPFSWTSLLEMKARGHQAAPRRMILPQHQQQLVCSMPLTAQHHGMCRLKLLSSHSGRPPQTAMQQPPLCLPAPPTSRKAPYSNSSSSSSNWAATTPKVRSSGWDQG